MPETDSKIASVRLISSDEAMNGTAPATASVSHSMLTSRKPKRVVACGGRPCVASATAIERPPRNSAEKAKTCQSAFPVARSTTAGTSIASARYRAKMEAMWIAARKALLFMDRRSATVPLLAMASVRGPTPGRVIARICVAA